MDNAPDSRHNERDVVRKRAVFSGRVQGVGFRYTAQELAQDFAVSGYVRNLADGTVEVQAEGEPDQVSDFLAAISRRLAGCIEKASVEDAPSSGITGFRIRY
ncbi:MAG TPA: acylphosphatase [Gemmataceae bacterium]|jgi:acylphosphatase|nr:acylphosphatase [Gemmataceae bacterium]